MTQAKTIDQANLPLQGLKVIEFTHMVMGPAAGMILADLGAQCTKIEPIKGESTRTLLGAGSGFFALLNRNKRSIRLDLKSPQGVAIARRLCEQADVVIENFKPGTLKKFGLDYASIREKNPKLIYCTLKGFLPGPYEKRTALDAVVQMMGGLAYMTGRAGDPLRAGASVNDIMGGMFGVIGILSALIRRGITGHGCEVESSLFENTTFLVASHMLEAQIYGRPNTPMPQGKLPWGIYDIFTVKNNRQIFLAAVSDGQFAQFCKALGLEALLSRPEFATNNDRVLHKQELLQLVSDAVKNRSLEEMEQIMEEQGLPFAPIRRPDELLNDPHLMATGDLVDVTLTDGPAAGKTVKSVLLPFAFDGKRLGQRSNPPAKGADTDTVLAEAGFSAQEITDLKKAGAAA